MRKLVRIYIVFVSTSCSRSNGLKICSVTMQSTMRTLLAVIIFLACCIDLTHQFAFPRAKFPRRGKAPGVFVNVSNCHNGDCNTRFMDPKALWRLTQIRGDILKKLQPDPEPHHVPKPTTTGVMEPKGRISNIPPLVSFSEHTNVTDDRSCMQFQLPNGVGNGPEVTGGHLWIHIKKKGNSKQRRLKLRVSTIKPNKRFKVISKLRVRVKSTMWQKISLPVSVIDKFTKSNSNSLQLCIRCKKCNRNYKIILYRRKNKNVEKLRDGSVEKRPFLVIHTREPSTRVMRSADNECSGCCKRSTYLSFRDLTWDDWIVSPQGYTLTECQGSCNRNGTEVARHRHPRRRGRPNRCRATRTSSIYLVYFDADLNLAYKLVPDAIIDECACE